MDKHERRITPADDLEMMRHPERWPAWPKLPLINDWQRDDVNGLRKLGVLFATDPPTFKVGNLWSITSDGAEPVDVERLIADGWRVD